MDCDEDAHCCVEGECADCSEADPDNFNPDDCVPDSNTDDFMFIKMKKNALVFCDDSESRCIECNARTGHCCL
jgi:hypothetical protein